MNLSKELVRVFLACMVLVTCSLAAQEAPDPAALDEIVLKNGSRLLGTVTDTRDGVVTMETEFAGTLSIAMDQIDTVHTVNPTVILLTDDTVLSETPLVIEQDQLLVSGGADAAYSLELLDVVNPEPWELGQGYKWSGLANLAIVMERGNTDSDEFDYKLESIWRSTRDRFTLLWKGERDEVNGVRNADNWKLSGKYDYFLEEPWYVGALATAERDKFADLDGRYAIGPYIGRQFYDEPVFTLSGEFGLSYVREAFFVGEDNNYAASTWNLHAKSDYLGGESQMYFDQTGLWNLEETSNVVVDTTLGLAFPLMWSLEAAAELVLEYDSSVSGDIDELDRTYRLRVGYSW